MDGHEHTHTVALADPADLNVVLRGSGTANGVVVFLRSRPHGRLTALDEYIAAGLEVRGFATAHVNLMTPDEQAADDRTGCFHLDQNWLRARGIAVLQWIRGQDALRHLPLGLFADGAAAAAALLAAAAEPELVSALVCLEGRVDLAGPAATGVRAPTLLLVAAENTHLADLNRQAQMQITGARLELVPRTDHRYEDARAISHVGWRTVEWFSATVRR